MSFVAGNAIVDFWEALDFGNATITGLDAPTDFVLTMIRESGTTGIAATETITLVEIGVTGRYAISFTPDNPGIYKLYLVERAGAIRLRTWVYSFEVVSAGSVFAPSFANAFCAETDMERWLQQTITLNTQPSSNEAAGFAEARAAILMSLISRLGTVVTPTSVTAGSRLEDLLREANAVGASMDYTIAASFGFAPSKTDRIVALQEIWNRYVGDPARPDVPGYIEVEVAGSLSSLSTDHIVTGDTTAAVVEIVTAEAIQIGMDDVF